MIKIIRSFINSLFQPSFKVAETFRNNKEIVAITLHKHKEQNDKVLTLTQQELEQILILALYAFRKYPFERLQLIDSFSKKNNFFIVANSVMQNTDIRVEINKRKIVGFNILLESYNLNILVSNYNYLEMLKEILNNKVFE